MPVSCAAFPRPIGAVIVSPCVSFLVVFVAGRCQLDPVVSSSLLLLLV